MSMIKAIAIVSSVLAAGVGVYITVDRQIKRREAILRSNLIVEMQRAWWDLDAAMRESDIVLQTVDSVMIEWIKNNIEQHIPADAYPDAKIKEVITRLRELVLMVDTHNAATHPA